MYSLDGLFSLFGTCCSMSSSNYLFLTWIQISQEAGQVVWYSHLFENFPQFVVIHTVKGFGIVTKSEIDLFLELSCFFDGLWFDHLIKFDLWFLCLFKIQLEYLQVLSSCTVEAWLGKFWALLCWLVRWVQLCTSLNILWCCLSLGLEL